MPFTIPSVAAAAIAGAAILATGLAGWAGAQERRASHCIAIADAAPGIEYLHRASFTEPPEPFSVRLRYIDHSMFLISTAGGVDMVTDYAGYLGPVDFVPEVVTMNQGHSTHWTARPDPRIPHVLPGWEVGGVAADHHLEIGEVLVRNVPTDTRGGWGGEIRQDGNSIFVFEAEGLCIGHLGHLHHEPDAMQYAALGRLDVVLAAVDGGLTLDHATMFRIMERLRSSIVVPMHWFGESTLQRFLAGMREGGFAVEETGSHSMQVSLRTLPSRPTVMVLRPAFLSSGEAADAPGLEMAPAE